MDNILNESKKHIMSARAGPWMVTRGSSPVALALDPGRGFLMAPTPGAQPGLGPGPVQVLALLTPPLLTPDTTAQASPDHPWLLRMQRLQQQSRGCWHWVHSPCLQDCTERLQGLVWGH